MGRIRVLEGIERELYLANTNAMNGVNSSIDSSTVDSTSSIDVSAGVSKAVKVESFTVRCPRHFCDTCHEFYGAVDTSDLCYCIYCPRAFHSNCIPPGCRFNAVCLVCDQHPDRLLPALRGANKESDKEEDGRVPHGRAQGPDSTVALFWDQLSVPDLLPQLTTSLPFDNSFKLRVQLKEDVDNTPQNYTSIIRNEYDTLPASKFPSVVTPTECCECRDYCDDTCLNHVLRVECCDFFCAGREGKVCKLGSKSCGNRRLQQRDYVQVKVFKEGDMGWGLRTVQAVSKGQLVIEYVGEIIDDDEMQKRLLTQTELTPQDKDFYIMELDTGLYVDGKKKGNLSRFINHSCDPNCELQRWNVKGRLRIAIVAIKDIGEDESLSYDYQFDTQEENVFKCYCGSSKCRGTMAPRKRDRLALQAIQSNDKELRMKLMLQGKQRASKFMTAEAKQEEEMSRSYTSKFLPGDLVSELRHGPPRSLFPLAKERRIFLARNALTSRGIMRRKELMEKRAAERQSSSSSISSVKKRKLRSSIE
jgi:hypothetical protein